MFGHVQSSGHPGYALMRRLKSLYFHCKEWNKKVFNKEVEQTADIDKQIVGIDALKESGFIFEADYNRRIAFKVDLLIITILEAKKWR